MGKLTICICETKGADQLRGNREADQRVCFRYTRIVQFRLLHPSRHLTSVGRQIDVRLRRHNDVGFRLILKVCLTTKKTSF